MKATLSVCVIYSNESVHIERFIDSFLPIADEFVFVRAIGCREPDDTLEKIKKKCSLEGVKVVLGEYENSTPETKLWPHVDRFDRARQLSFDLATSELRMWADCDDVLPPQTIFVITGIKDNPEAQLYFGIYSLPTSDTTFLRERIMGRVNCNWMSPVHESVIFSAANPPTRLIHEGLVIEHRPMAKPMPSLDRNLKILEYWVNNLQPGDWEPQFWFYINRDNWIHPDAVENGGIKRSIEAGIKAAAFPNLGIVERYECWLNMSEALAQHAAIGVPVACPLPPESETWEPDVLAKAIKEAAFKQRERWLINAFRIDPSRREALVALSMLEHDRKSYGRALAYAHAMRGIPEPESKPWTHRKSFYTWKGAMTLTIGYRRTGKEEQAREIEEHVFSHHKRQFSVLHATRRGTEAVHAMMLWLEQAANASAVEWIFAVDEDDRATIDALFGYRVVKVKPGLGPVAAWNEAAKNSTGNILVQMSDDWIPANAWDQIIFTRLEDKRDGEAVLKISDGHRKDELMCMAILTRKYYDRYGYIFYPEYFSVYSDNEFSLQAKRDGVIIDASDVVFHHFHPAFSKEKPMDEVYARSNAPERYAQGKAILDKRMHLFEQPFFEVVK